MNGLEPTNSIAVASAALRMNVGCSVDLSVTHTRASGTRELPF